MVKENYRLSELRSMNEQAMARLGIASRNNLRDLISCRP
jgi:hypothetical protein